MILIVVIFGAAMPNYVRPRGQTSAATASPVTVLAQQKVGIYNTATISSFDGQALVLRLTMSMNFLFRAGNAVPVISSYSAEKWGLVDREIWNSKRAAHPVGVYICDCQAGLSSETHRR